MKFIKSALAYLVGAEFMVRLNAALTVLFVLLVPASMIFGWLESVAFVSVLSLWALVSGHLSAALAARVEKKTDEQINTDD